MKAVLAMGTLGLLMAAAASAQTGWDAPLNQALIDSRPGTCQAAAYMAEQVDTRKHDFVSEGMSQDDVTNYVLTSSGTLHPHSVPQMYAKAVTQNAVSVGWFAADRHIGSKALRSAVHKDCWDNYRKWIYGWVEPLLVLQRQKLL